MKKIIHGFFFLLVLFVFFITAVTSAQSITGNGNVIRETRTVSPFNEIESDGVFNVYISQGSSENIVVEADDNIVPFITTISKNNKLKLSSKDEAEIKKSTKLNIYVTVKNIDKINFSGVGDLETEGKLNLTELKIDNSGVGNIKLEIDCDRLDIENNSVGNINLTGKADNVKIEHNGVGNVKAFDLTANTLKIESNAVGNAEVNSEKELYMDLNGMGNITYKGNAVIKSLNKNGLGDIKKL